VLASQLRAAGFGDVRFDTCFEIPRGTQRYSVFLVVARRS
jgi:hypothetical protein